MKFSTFQFVMLSLVIAVAIAICSGFNLRVRNVYRVWNFFQKVNSVLPDGTVEPNSRRPFIDWRKR